MQGNALILINQEKKSVKKIQGILGCTGVNICVFESLNEAVDYAKNLPKPVTNTVAIADYENRHFLLEAENIDSQIGKIIIIDRQLDDVLNDIPDLSHIDSVVAKNFEVIANPRELISTTQKMVRRDIFGLNKYLTWGFEEYSCKLYDSAKRQEVMSLVSDFAMKVSGRKPIGRIITDLLDELLMNAVYDANPKYADVDRTEHVILSEEECVTIKWGCDGHLFGVSVSDPFGRLEKDTVISFLKKCFAKGDDMIHYGDGGAGIGLFKILKSINSFVINIESGKKTEAIGIIDMSLSMKEFKTLTRSFHFFRT